MKSLHRPGGRSMRFRLWTSALLIVAGSLLLTASVASAGPKEDVGAATVKWARSEEHTSELQSRRDLVCRLLLEKKKIYKSTCLLCAKNATSSSTCRKTCVSSTTTSLPIYILCLSSFCDSSSLQPESSLISSCRI